MPTKLFIHGLESSGKGTKGTFFKKTYPDMIVEDFLGNFEERMLKLTTVSSKKDDLVIVGSSYGGLMATFFASHTLNKIRKLILLAPALNHMPSEFFPEKSLDLPVYIYHGNHDEIIPPGPVREIANKIFSNPIWNLVDDDHSLHKTFFSLNWNILLS
ncbi:MAG: dienelactone hydrolase family protein [Proteobacteria bacterium]|nr:dienelactone hydrolase family protein [Pseudomonadota bacterium]